MPLTITRPLILCAAIAALLCSCAKEDDAWSDLARETDEAITAAGEVAKEGAEKLGQALSTRLEGMGPQLETLKSQIREGASGAKDELMKQWESLADRRKELRASLESAGEGARGALTVQLDDLEKALRELQAKLK